MSTPGVPPWGVPWHGKVQGGVLTLPNGAAMAWPQPDGTLATVLGKPLRYYARAGYTYRQKVPGVAPVVRSAVELAADQAQGRAWLDAALISGSMVDSYLHSKASLGWIYCAPDGSRWRITGASASTNWSASGLSYSIQARRFGELGAAAATHSGSASLTVAGMGQQAWDETKELRYADVESIRPDGAAAIILLHSVSVSGSGSQIVVSKKDMALGFLQLNLVGTPGVDFAASLTQLRSAAQAAGSVAASPATHTTAYTSLVTVREIDNQAIDNPPTCSGYMEGTETVTLVADASGGGVSTYDVATGAETLVLSGRILTMWYTPTGEIEELTLDCTASIAWDLPAPSRSYTAISVYRTDNSYNDGCTLPGDTEWIWSPSSPSASDVTERNSRSSSQLTSCTFTLKGAGQEIVVSATSANAITTSYERTMQNTVLISASGEQSQTWSDTLDGGLWESSSQIDYADQNRPGAGTAGVAFGTLPAGIFSGIASGNGAYSNKAGAVRVAKYANGAIGLVATDNASRLRWSDAITPAGLAPGTTEATAQAASTAWFEYRPYGSFNPLSGEAVIASLTPVSWT